MKTKNIKYLILPILILAAEAAEAQKAISGMKTISGYVTSAGMILGPLFFMLAGIMFMVDRQRGVERVTGVVIGTMILGGAASIFSLIYGAMS